MSHSPFLRPGPSFASLLLYAWLAVAPAAAGTLPEWLQLHTFGGWAYAETDGNLALIGSASGEADNFQLGLNVQATPHDRLALVVQIDTEQEPIGDEFELELDYAFAEWTFSDAVKLRAGRVKHPFGIYGETFEIGTLRPFFLLPESIYGPQGLTAEWYAGFGLTGVRFLGRWGLEYDIYAGEIRGELEAQGFIAQSPDPSQALSPRVGIDFQIENTWGLRLQALSPVAGLSFGTSLYTGEQELEIPIAVGAGPARYNVSGLHLQYLGGRWTVRTEAARFTQRGLFESQAFYVEGEVRLGQRWRLAARYDHLDTKLLADLSVPLPPGIEQIFGHEELALGVSFWPRRELVIRLNVLHLDGNRFAFPEDPAVIAAFLQGGAVDSTTRMVILGAQFSF